MDLGNEDTKEIYEMMPGFLGFIAELMVVSFIEIRSVGKGTSF